MGDVVDAQQIIAKRIAQELRPGMLVNLGIGIPTLVTNYTEGVHIFFQSENGLIGTGALPEAGAVQPRLTDAAGRPVAAPPRAATFGRRALLPAIRGRHPRRPGLRGPPRAEDGRGRHPAISR